MTKTSYGVRLSQVKSKKPKVRSAILVQFASKINKLRDNFEPRYNK